MLGKLKTFRAADGVISNKYKLKNWKVWSEFRNEYGDKCLFAMKNVGLVIIRSYVPRVEQTRFFISGLVELVYLKCPYFRY